MKLTPPSDGPISNTSVSVAGRHNRPIRTNVLDQVALFAARRSELSTAGRRLR